MHLPLRLHGCKLFPSIPHHIITLHMIDRLCFTYARCAATHDIDVLEVVRGTGWEVGTRCVHRRQLFNGPGLGLKVVSKRVSSCVHTFRVCSGSPSRCALRSGKCHLASLGRHGLLILVSLTYGESKSASQSHRLPWNSRYPCNIRGLNAYSDALKPPTA